MTIKNNNKKIKHCAQTSFHKTNSNFSKEENTAIRINKALADTGICSRRKAEELILAGKVTINGETISNLAHKVFSEDIIYVNEEKINRSAKRTYLMMHKPVQTICTANDPEGRITIFDILPSKWKTKRLFTVGRLDYFSEGLLLLTDDGNFAQKLAHPRYHLPKVYQVIVRESITPEKIEIMQNGMTLKEGEKLAPIKINMVRKKQNSTLLEMTLHQGINRQIRRMCRDLDLTILKLTRISHGLIVLDISEGEVRELTKKELNSL